jgi:hypothetical protein
MALFGSLRSMPLTDVLQWLGTTRKTGTLVLERDKVVKQIVFREGRVVGCSSDDPPELLGHYLVAQGKISEETLREALVRQAGTREYLGKILVGMQALNPDDLTRLLTSKAEETIFSLFDWEDAEFRFDEDRDPSGYVFPVEIGIEDVLLRGLKRYDEMKRIRTVFNDPGIVLTKTDREPPAEVFKNRLTKRIHDLITGDRTVAEILLHAHASEFLVTKFLFELFRNGIVEIAEVRPIRPAFAPATAPPPEQEAVACAAPVVSRGASAEARQPRPVSPAAVPPPAPAMAELQAARALMESGEFEGALDILNSQYRLHPGDESLRRLVAEAEAAFVDKAYRYYVPPHKIPVLRCPAESLTSEDLSPVEFFFLSRFNGTWDIRSIIQIAPIREVEALRTLKRLREKGFVELRDAE